MKTAELLSGGRNIIHFYRNTGVSPDAAIIRKESDQLQQNFARTISYGERLSQIVEVLLQLREEYSKDNWDSYDSKKLDILSFNNSLRLALTFPNKIPVPEIDVIPSGQVVFSWIKGNRQLFSFIVGNRNELSYAGIFGANKIYGVEYFDENIPTIILDNIERVFSS